MAKDVVGDLIQNQFLVLLVGVRQGASAPLLRIEAERAGTPRVQWLGFDGRSSNEAAVGEEGLAIVLDSAASQLVVCADLMGITQSEAPQRRRVIVRQGW